jgi:GntR family transcriptional repressor for pyruvate dehydrogenase complex
MQKAKKTAPLLAAEIIQQRIRTGVYPPAAALPGQRELAEELGMGRPAIREAISALEGLGLLRVEPGRGVFVAAPGAPAAGRWRFETRYRLADVYAVRAALESVSVLLAAGHAGASGLGELDQLVGRLADAVARDDLIEMSLADRDFHRKLAELSGNVFLQDMLDSFDPVLTESRNVAFADTNRKNREAPVIEHREIVDFIRAGNAEAASRSMKKHIAHAQTRSEPVHGKIGKPDKNLRRKDG